MRPLALLLLLPLMAAAQAPDFPAPKTFPPDETTLKKIKDKTAELKKATEKIDNPDVLVYLKAAEWIVKHEEWYSEKSAQQTLEVLDAGLERAKNADKKPWLEVRGKGVVRGYQSRVDGSVQPFSVRYPDEYDPKKKYRADIILHGRDSTLTEVKFIHVRETAKKGKPLDHFEVEVYGRGNNAYRWAGEKDVFEVIAAVKATGAVDNSRVVLRGFSMGGAGTWHIGLHYPFDFAVVGPGAGFSTTREYIGKEKFGSQPDYIEKCLHIYDAVDYAENAFNVPIVAYSGEKDPQKLAADLIEARLKDFKEPHSFTHLIAPGLKHQQPADWLAKLEDEYQKHLKEALPEVREQFRFVTYSPYYCGYSTTSAPLALPVALTRQYEKAVVEASVKDGVATVVTANVRMVITGKGVLGGAKTLSLDGQAFPVDKLGDSPAALERVEGRWTIVEWKRLEAPLKTTFACGPIDDAFRDAFVVYPTTGKPWHEESAALASARREEFAKNWSKYFRGEVRERTEKEAGSVPEGVRSVLLFGDPGSNPAIAKVLPKLPITWTKDKLVMNGKEYDPKTHLPVLIYPDPESRISGRYVVINSGHTFREADLRGTNALLYPRLGDWAVLKPKPTKDDPAGFEVVDADRSPKRVPRSLFRSASGPCR